MPIDGVAVKRMLRAPCARVFEAWTRADWMARWFFPGEGWTAADTADLKVGGRSCTAHDMPSRVGTTLNWRIKDAGGSVVVSLDHSGWKGHGSRPRGPRLEAFPRQFEGISRDGDRPALVDIDNGH
ncbi:MAG TPA: SRPBCC domain-containing protein [Polyangiaceae bacterium]|nr:SRPBCC domain-containing protein [Polyangiaceae bacterium]